MRRTIQPKTITRDAVILSASPPVLHLGDRVRVDGRAATLTHHRTTPNTWRCRYLDATTPTAWLARDRITAV